jgi:hypothetical protein
VITTRARPARNALINERLAVTRRLSTALADLDGADRAADEDLVELRQTVSEALRRIAEIDQGLAEHEATSPLELNLPEPSASPYRQRIAARGRLLVALTVLHDMPSSCSGAVRLLRKQIRKELRTIEASRREEFPSCD